MSADQVRRAADAGIEIGSHGLRHVSLPGMAEAALAAEAEESRAILTETTGRDVIGFCYPYGHIDDSSMAAIQAAGYSYGCAIWRSASTGPHALPRVYVGDADAPAAPVGQRRPALAGMGLPGPGCGAPGPRWLASGGRRTASGGSEYSNWRNQVTPIDGTARRGIWHS